ncbi:MAG: 4a-hydroxytetrahydrobiopterin dehydratase [Bacteroidia bacterium]|nr:4a-hydroxytetrahydrobiopterin dehydratase [Bacteroidia bacterium]MBT8274615.1 4a-hydroxytetrahydrobiopterin dehydratase [Bacteroidia bacterium]NNF31293.1 4a-hydroxytetrahydrobiopterin dehydratase [Flavobacteriaceae bacterium]NNK54215.1 4a-hydroxytetrahydrobiopterin dehydratase [Flavobacteriaceae bacterium]NNM08352.1 4a-hydroxytetrahydrobiopterin dehydratase [Flavobacteriaceae bacterium]
MKALSEADIRKRLQSLEGWEYNDNAIHTAFEFENFKEAFTIMTRIAFEAEKLDHHPDWSNVYNQLHISLYTHSENGVTEKDLELAETINRLVS